MKISSIVLAIISSFSSVITLPVKATETRCGWLHNPTPANWFLRDRDGTWVISRQGGYQAEGMDNIPSDEKEYVRTNGYYGYGCACLDVTTDTNRMRTIAIQGGEALPLSTCREDPHLPKE